LIVFAFMVQLWSRPNSRSEYRLPLHAVNRAGGSQQSRLAARDSLLQTRSFRLK